MGAASRTLLVVEDEFASLEVLALLLEGEGYRVLTASDGESALALLEHDHVDLVLADDMMPKMNGIELCERIRHDERFQDLPVILMSATCSADNQARAQSTAYFSKPLSIKKVVAAIRKVLGEPTCLTSCIHPLSARAPPRSAAAPTRGLTSWKAFAGLVLRATRRGVHASATTTSPQLSSSTGFPPGVHKDRDIFRLKSPYPTPRIPGRRDL